MTGAMSEPDTDFSQKSFHSNRHILLADDDADDCALFKEALDELKDDSQLTTVCNGEKLMQLLYTSEHLPDVLFLDLNMPLKNGFECLSEIKRNENLCRLPVIIISTSFDRTTADRLYKNGAKHCIRKPNDFEKLKEVIHDALRLNQASATE
jgi:CheY-like chemotaxis protein